LGTLIPDEFAHKSNYFPLKLIRWRRGMYAHLQYRVASAALHLPPDVASYTDVGAVVAVAIWRWGCGEDEILEGLFNFKVLFQYNYQGSELFLLSVI
jgi:hypothetical protein